eukprot:CAMPEP_0180089240 /NCGR_PEP_ID=MMETSP0985-20121206/22689_1 /TAXON_ID=483367 /ORGANISM="non described non described, Strain CCMP 2436" /LENGTH=67 /DNA_ID=CAMNT_0022023755 /DNA_START=23 /DNA_END=226 /DNA_ORIENTATION=+
MQTNHSLVLHPLTPRRLTTGPIAGGALLTATSWEATLVCIGSMCALYGVCAFVLLTASTAQQAQSED